MAANLQGLATTSNVSGLAGSAPVGNKPWGLDIGQAFSNFDFNSIFNQGKKANNASSQNPEQSAPQYTTDSAAKKTFGNFANGFMSGLGKGGGFKGGMKAGWGAAAAAGGDLMASIGSGIGQRKYGEDFSEDQKAIQSGIRQVGSMFGPVGQIIAAATGAVDAIGSATGLNLSNIDKDAAKRAGISGTGFNRAMNYLPGNSMIWGGINAITGGKRTDSYSVSQEAQDMQSGYAGTLDDLRAASLLGNKRMFTRGQERKANDYIREQQQKDQILADLNVTNTMRKSSNYYQDLAHQNINRYAGENYLGLRVGREGLKLPAVEEVRAILAKRNQTEKFAKGGTIGVDVNLLPEGSLHARLNHLDELNPDLEDATKKGIPVMAVEGGQVTEQVAEIEHSELIFRLEVTKKLEELMKDGSEEAMIKAGKLAASEIIENTQDNVGMIAEEIENGKE